MDRTILYRELVRLANPQSLAEPEHVEPDAVTSKALEIASSIKHLDEYLDSVRSSYLAASGPQQMSDKDRDEIDYDVRRIVQTEARRIKQLEQAEKLRVEQRPQGVSRFFSDPREDGTSKTLQLHRQGMFIYLNDQLKRAGDAHAHQQQVRYSREAHKLSRRKIPVPAPQNHAGMPLEQPAEAPESEKVVPDDLQLTPQQQELLFAENNVLLNELNATLDQAHQAEKSMAEIASIQTELATHLASQTEMIQQLVDDAFKTTDDVGSANLQLEKAKKRNRRASQIIIYASLAIAFLLLIYDWLL